MAYNTSKHCVVRMKRYLNDMAEAKKTITWPASDPRKMAYHIREAMYASQRYPEFKAFHGLRDWYRISPRQGWVEAEYLGLDEGDRPAKVNIPERLTVGEVEDVHGVVGACIKFAEKADEIYFPNVKKLKEEEKLAVHQWGKGSSPPWQLIDHEEAGVTMTRKQGVNEMFIWRPEGA